MKFVVITFMCAIAVGGCFAQSAASRTSFIGPFDSIKAKASTVPQNGDVNPYGVAVVPVSAGKLEQGNVLVSNFNNADNLQGTVRPNRPQPAAVAVSRRHRVDHCSCRAPLRLGDRG